MDPNCEPVRCFRRSKWFPQGFFLNTISCLSHSPQPFQNLSSFPFFCYFTVNVVKIKRASSSSGRILFFFSKPNHPTKKVSFWFFLSSVACHRVFGKIKCLCWSLPFSRASHLPAMSHFIQERVTFTVHSFLSNKTSPFAPLFYYSSLQTHVSLSFSAFAIQVCNCVNCCCKT